MVIKVAMSNKYNRKCASQGWHPNSLFLVARNSLLIIRDTALPSGSFVLFKLVYAALIVNQLFSKENCTSDTKG